MNKKIKIDFIERVSPYDNQINEILLNLMYNIGIEDFKFNRESGFIHFKIPYTDSEKMESDKKLLFKLLSEYKFTMTTVQE